MKDNDFNLKQEYEKLQKKHKLPNFEELDNDLEMSISIEKSSFLLRTIRRRLHEKAAFFSRILEGVIYPNTSSLLNIQESKFFTEKEKEEISKIYKRLATIERDSNVLDVEGSDEENAKFISNSFKEFQEIKAFMKEITKKMAESWKEESFSKKEGYFG